MTPRIIDHPLLTRHLVTRGAFLRNPVFVVDIGASGGIDSYWYEFQNQLGALGFDPLTAEVDRLNADAVPGVRYVAAWVKSPSEAQAHDGPSTQFFPRTSAARAAKIASLDYAREYFNSGADIEFATDRIVLDAYFTEEDRMNIDFIKVDTDGHDYEVLLGCREILGSGRILGLAVETPFQGPVGREASVFSSIDVLLREVGFSLFDLEVFRYSRAALPARFVYDIPANTVTGQVSWGEAIYFRDLGDPNYESTRAFEPTTDEVLKLACMFEIFGVPDCSAELVLKYGEQIGGRSEQTKLLDLLATEQQGADTTYADLLREFSEDARTRFGATRDLRVL